MSYYNKKYIQILKWGVRSKETANYTYDLTERKYIVSGTDDFRRLPGSIAKRLLNISMRHVIMTN